MFAVIGKGSFTKENLISFLIQCGFDDPSVYVSEAEKKGRVTCGKFKILIAR